MMGFGMFLAKLLLGQYTPSSSTMHNITEMGIASSMRLVTGALRRNEIPSPSVRAAARIKEVLHGEKDEVLKFKKMNFKTYRYSQYNAMYKLHSAPGFTYDTVDIYIAWVEYFVSKNTPFFPPLPLTFDCIDKLEGSINEYCVDDTALKNLTRKYPTFVDRIKTANNDDENDLIDPPI